MKKHVFLVWLLVLAALLMGCENQTDDTKATVATEPQASATESSVETKDHPSFAVETVSAAKGDTDVVVNISLENNPGFLTMSMDIVYDSENMTLTDVVGGSDYSDYYFVGPKNMQSGCTASWFLPELPETILDGNILQLHFTMNPQTESGSYMISVNRSASGGIVDQNKNEIIFDDAIGYININ